MLLQFALVNSLQHMVLTHLQKHGMYMIREAIIFQVKQRIRHYILANCFTVLPNYAVYVKSRSSSNVLTVNPHDGIPVAPFQVAPNLDTSPTKKFMKKIGANYFSLSFNAPSDFEGYVSEWLYQ